MQSNRRNFYRTLQVQPDAPLDIIKNNYRTLLQKLRLHPDLGGENLTASIINLAYATLRNSAKRAAYDRKLLNQYKIEALSKGHLSQKKSKNNATSNKTCEKKSNRRNYYRVLHIQPDAPLAIITSSYKMLVKKKTASTELNQEAFSILRTPIKRQQYDQLLKQNRHVNSTTLNSIIRNKKNTNDDTPYSRTKPKGNKYSSKQSSGQKKNSPYQPLITCYCIFCKTPQSYSPIKNIHELCIECFSPLHSSKESFSHSGRIFTRIDLTSTLSFYTYWPSIETTAILSDLSPAGLCFTTKQALIKNQIIKIDTDQFKAVGKVKHIKCTSFFFTIGIQFLTIQFNTQTGTFMSTSV